MNPFVKLQYYFTEIRAHRYIKNLLIFFVLLWAGPFSTAHFIRLLIGFIALCAVSGVVYLVNDLKDLQLDLKHPRKKLRPYADGKISKQEMYLLIATLLFIGITVSFFVESTTFQILLASYVVLNILYTMIFKHIPYLEMLVLAMFYGFRIASGFVLLSVPVPVYLVVAMMGVAIVFRTVQRSVELEVHGTKARPVLEKYSQTFLRSFLTIGLFMTVISYYVATALITGPVAYSELILLAILMYLNEFIMPHNQSKKKTDDLLRLVTDNKDLLILVCGLIVTLIIFSILRGT